MSKSSNQKTRACQRAVVQIVTNRWGARYAEWLMMIGNYCTMVTEWHVWSLVRFYDLCLIHNTNIKDWQFMATLFLFGAKKEPLPYQSWFSAEAHSLVTNHVGKPEIGGCPYCCMSSVYFIIF